MPSAAFSLMSGLDFTSMCLSSHVSLAHIGEVARDHADPNRQPEQMAHEPRGQGPTPGPPGFAGEAFPRVEIFCEEREVRFRAGQHGADLDKPQCRTHAGAADPQIPGLAGNLPTSASPSRSCSRTVFAQRDRRQHAGDHSKGAPPLCTAQRYLRGFLEPPHQLGLADALVRLPAPRSRGGRKTGTPRSCRRGGGGVEALSAARTGTATAGRPRITGPGR